jgi:hypothetical protein
MTQVIAITSDRMLQDMTLGTATQTGCLRAVKIREIVRKTRDMRVLGYVMSEAHV